MPKYAFVYHGGARPETPEEGAKVMAAWNTWFTKMGAAVVDGGNPVGESKTVSNKGVANDGGANPVSGMSFIEAADMNAACTLAKGCPMVVDGSGTVEVAEVMPM